MMNRTQVLVVMALLALAINVCAKKGFGPGDQDWDYVDVREGAHMFYWLYYTTAEVANYTDRPLVIWLQGGPGGSSTGFGNFMELGPLDVNGNYRNFTWIKDMNVLFIDNPVGTGFSYVDHIRYLTTTNKQIALDLVELMKGFYAKHPEFETVPLHIFCESYGGKMAPEFAWELYEAIQRKEIKSNFTSVALGDPWTSPIDSVLNWGPLLWNMGNVDRDGYENIMRAANKTARLVKQEKWIRATKQWGATQSVVLQESKGVDFYNIGKPITDNSYQRMLMRSHNYESLMYRTLVQYDVEEDEDEKLQKLMRGPVTEDLGIPSNVKWGSQSQQVFSAHSGDFMKPVIYIVNELLDKTDLNVAVYTGQLDLICATAGTVDWVDKLQWNYRDEYVNASRNYFSVNGILEGYEKSVKKFFMFWVNRAGHMVPLDNPAAMGHILKTLTNFGL